MTIWTVFVYDGLNHHFVDTSWAREEAAQRRVVQIEQSMKATCFGGTVKIFKMQVEDCEIKATRTKLDAPGQEGR